MGIPRRLDRWGAQVWKNATGRDFSRAALELVAKRILRVVEVLALLVLINWLGAPPPILVTLGPPQTVVTTNSKIGVHTRLTDEVEEWKIKKTLEMVREMGAPWIVDYFPWGYIENEEGQFDWDHADLVVNHARQQGITIIARLGFVPGWARPRESVTSYLDEAHYPQYAQFVRAFVEHFKGRVDYVVLWNEPNLNFEWGYRPVDPEGYTRLLQAVYPIAKEANPEVKILAGALAPTLAPPGSTDAMSDLDYLQRMYAAGAKDYFDLLAIHSYGWTAAADEAPSPARVNFRRTELLREIMVKNGDAAKHAIITEGGWNDHPRWTKAVHPAERIADTLRAYDLAEQWDWLDACVLWAFRYPAPAQTYQDYFTFVTPDFDPKPIYYEVQKYAAR
jgi:hypothetical protein